MDRHTFLGELHRLVRPRNYLEIGVNDGRSLALSHAPSVAIDPAFKVTVPLRCDVHLVKATSDAFFARSDPLRHLRGGRNPLRNLARGRPILGGRRRAPALDLAFIDGMHLFEFVLRDFMNVERHAGPWSVIVLDDMLPRTVDEAARERHTRAWTGDVYKLIPVLARHRPDLLVVAVNTAPTGLLVVLGADPASGVLAERYEALVAEWVQPDPQTVPAEILERRGALDPEVLLSSTIWRDLVRARRLRLSRRGVATLRRHLAALPS
jgi:hypothetical protein